jgi:hypothetical protein
LTFFGALSFFFLFPSFLFFFFARSSHFPRFTKQKRKQKKSYPFFTFPTLFPFVFFDYQKNNNNNTMDSSSSSVPEQLSVPIDGPIIEGVRKYDQELIDAAKALYLLSGQATAAAAALAGVADAANAAAAAAVSAVSSEKQAKDLRTQERARIALSIKEACDLAHVASGTDEAAKAISFVAETREKVLRDCLSRLVGAGTQAHVDEATATFERLWRHIAKGVHTEKPHAVNIDMTGVDPADAPKLAKALGYFIGVETVFVAGTGPALPMNPSTISMLGSLTQVVLSGPKMCMGAYGVACLAMFRSMPDSQQKIPGTIKVLTFADFDHDKAAVGAVQEALNLLTDSLGRENHSLQKLDIVRLAAGAPKTAKALNVRPLIDAIRELPDKGKSGFLDLHLSGFTFEDETATAESLARLIASPTSRLEGVSVPNGLPVAPLIEALETTKRVKKLVWASDDVGPLLKYFKTTPVINTLCLGRDKIDESKKVWQLVRNKHLRTLSVGDDIGSANMLNIIRLMTKTHSVTTFVVAKSMFSKRVPFTEEAVRALTKMLEDSSAIHTVNLPRSCVPGKAFEVVRGSRIVAEKFNIVQTKYEFVIRRKLTAGPRVSATIFRKGFKPATTFLRPHHTIGFVRTSAACSLDLDVDNIVLLRADTLAPLCNRETPPAQLCTELSTVFGDSRYAFIILLEGEEIPTRKRKNQEEEEESSQPESKRQRTEEEVPVVVQPEL